MYVHREREKSAKWNSAVLKFVCHLLFKSHFSPLSFISSASLYVHILRSEIEEWEQKNTHRERERVREGEEDRIKWKELDHHPNIIAMLIEILIMNKMIRVF